MKKNTGRTIRTLALVLLILSIILIVGAFLFTAVPTLVDAFEYLFRYLEDTYWSDWCLEAAFSCLMAFLGYIVGYAFSGFLCFVGYMLMRGFGDLVENSLVIAENSYILAKSKEEEE